MQASLTADAQTQYERARRFKGGAVGVDQDEVEAAKCFWSAAYHGHAAAQYELALCYQNGTGVAPDEAEAVRWLREAALQGHADAQFELGECYAWAYGVEQDDEEVLRWHHAAATGGNAKARCEMGRRFLFGTGVEKDAALGMSMLRAAARDGVLAAKLELGYQYLHGFALPQDLAEAAMWYVQIVAGLTQDDPSLSHHVGMLLQCAQSGDARALFVVGGAPPLPARWEDQLARARRVRRAITERARLAAMCWMWAGVWLLPQRDVRQMIGRRVFETRMDVAVWGRVE